MRPTQRRKRTPARRCRIVRDKRTRRRKKVCRKRPRKRHVAPIPQPLPLLAVPSAAAPPPTAPPELVPPGEGASGAPGGDSGSGSGGGSGTGSGGSTTPPPVATDFSRRQAERLLWRAGFGPRPGDVDRLAALGLRGAVESLTRVSGTAPLNGPAPHDQNGNPIDPRNVWGHDHLWWLDRMVRSEHQLVERMALIWHDWFATSNNDVGDANLMLGQNDLFRAHALGSFETLALEVTKNPAMLVFLNGVDNRRGRPNENYARELMELFTLGADRGAYTETDVRELARALTGWRADWIDGWTNFRFDPTRHDTGVKSLWAGTPYARSDIFDWQDAVRLCLNHPMHAEFFIRKLWSYFIPTPPSDETRASLESMYVTSGFQIRPVVEAILMHPDLYDEQAPLVKPPAVYNAGLLRARGRGIDTNDWAWLSDRAGQMLFQPPNVSGWNDQAWLDTATLRGRWLIAYYVLRPEEIPSAGYSTTETPEEALDKALAHWGSPTLTSETLGELRRFAGACIPSNLASWELGRMRAFRQNALRHLIAASPDFHAS